MFMRDQTIVTVWNIRYRSSEKRDNVWEEKKSTQYCVEYSYGISVLQIKRPSRTANFTFPHFAMKNAA